MLREMFSFEQFYSCQNHNAYGYCKGHYSNEGNLERKTQWYGTEEYVMSGLFHQNTTIQDNIVLPGKQQISISSSEFASFEHLCCDIGPSPSQLCLEELAEFTTLNSEIGELIPQESSSATPTNSDTKFKQSDYEKSNLPSHETACANTGEKLATKDLLRLAGEKLLQSTSLDVDSSALNHPFTASFCGLSDAERRDVEIIQHLLVSAEKVGEQQFSRANNLLNQCHQCSSIKGTPVQRLVYYFSTSLQQKIDQETGGRTELGSGKMQTLELKDMLMNPNRSLLASYQKLPFSQVILFTAVQVMLENVSEAKRIHIIDLEIRNGLHFAIMMEALAARSDCPLEHLKVTAVGTIFKHKIEETGQRLMSVAQSLNLSFSFNVVMVADMAHLHESLFKLDAEETLAVYSPCILSSMIEKSARVETLMKVILKLNPCIMIVTEVEANHNSPVFVNRFIEALFYYGAFFDSMEECMDPDDQDRMMTELVELSPAITNIVVFEGEERTIRHVTSNVWKAFFSRYGMVETELSRASIHQAKLLVDSFACASSCTLEMMGKSLAIGWKGTPIFSVSALKFL